MGFRQVGPAAETEPRDVRHRCPRNESSEASEKDPKAQMTYCPQQLADDKIPELLSSVFEITLLGFA